MMEVCTILSLTQEHIVEGREVRINQARENRENLKITL